MTNKILMITLIFTMAYTISLLGNNHLISNKLTPQQEYRKEFIKHNNINYLLELSKKELEILIPQLTNLKHKTTYQKKILLILKLLYYSKGIQAINKHDKIVISNYINTLKQNNLFLTKEIERLFTKKNNNFIKKMLQIEIFLKKHNDSRMIKYQTYNYLGPYIETYKTLCKFDENFNDKQIFRYLKQNKNCILKKELFKNAEIKDLLKKIEFGDKQIVKNYNKITPFIAKIILTEIVLSNLNKKEQKIFFDKIINKTDYSEFTCGKFCNQKEPRIKRNVNRIIIHNGYQLLNSIKGANIIDKYSKMFLQNDNIKLLSHNKPLKTAGIECSLFLQRAIERAKIAQIKGRMKTSYMDYSLVSSKIAKKHILNNEKQLKTGDIIKLKGHTYLFIGYKKINNHYYATTIEAVGGNLRSVGIFYRDFYEESLGGFNKKRDKHKNIISVSPDERYIIYRIK